MALAAAIAASSTGCIPPQEQREAKPYRPSFWQYPELVRTESVREKVGFDELAITVKPSGAAGWTIRVHNDGDKLVRIIWDDSTFVTSTGESAGRLIRAKTKKIDVEKSHAPSPVPPGAGLTEDVVVEKFVDYEELEADEQKDQEERGRIFQSPSKIKEARGVIERLMVGGRINLVLDVGGEPKTWVGEVFENGHRPNESDEPEAVEQPSAPVEQTRDNEEP